MKKSRIVLGASAVTLAIAGAFTSKANHRLFTTAYYYNGTACTSMNVSCGTGTNTCFTDGSTSPTNHNTLFTSSGSGTNCSGVLFKHRN